jgi:hypothetical protein
MKKDPMNPPKFNDSDSSTHRAAYKGVRPAMGASHEKSTPLRGEVKP